MITEEDVIPILKELVKIKTENPPGETLEAVNYIKNILEEYGIETKIQEYANGRANIIAHYGESKQTVILTGHLDTVPSGDETKWKYPPFAAIEHEGKIYGRGTTDMKGADAAFISVLIALKKKNIELNKKIIFLGTSDEEIGMDGSFAAKEDGIMEGCEFVLVGEPTELQVGIAEKGTLWIKIKIYGKSAHGSTPHLGISAIEGAASLIPKMKEVIPDFTHEIMGKSTVNIGKISGGTLINVVPEYCEFKCDIRLVSDNLREEVKTKLKKLIDGFNEQEPVRAEIEIIHEIPTIELKYETEIVKFLKKKASELGKNEIIGVNYGTDGAMLIPGTNVPFIIMGPGKLDQLHVTDEYTEKQEVIDYANIVYDALVENFG